MSSARSISLRANACAAAVTTSRAAIFGPRFTRLGLARGLGECRKYALVSRHPALALLFSSFSEVLPRYCGHLQGQNNRCVLIGHLGNS